MNIFSWILELDDFKEKPPILLDIGAATEIYEKWREIAQYSICIAFDPDSRQMDYIEKENGNFRKLYVFPAIIHAIIDGNTEFYLTASPECSSTLIPDNQALKQWYFSDFFVVADKIKINSMTLPAVLDKLCINYIDWFKTDSQGTDLRLFKSIGPELMQKVLAADFEPGLIDAYRNEDKFRDLLTFMDELKMFWISDCRLHGSQYFPRSIAERHLSRLERRLLPSVLRSSPGWAEVTYLNRFDTNFSDRRQYLLGWIFAMIEKQYGFALELAEKGASQFSPEIFDKLRKYTLKRIRRKMYLSPGIWWKAIKKLAR